MCQPWIQHLKGRLSHSGPLGLALVAPASSRLTHRLTHAHSFPPPSSPSAPPLSTSLTHILPTQHHSSSQKNVQGGSCEPPSTGPASSHPTAPVIMPTPGTWNYSACLELQLNQCHHPSLPPSPPQPHTHPPGLSNPALTRAPASVSPLNWDPPVGGGCSQPPLIPQGPLR